MAMLDTPAIASSTYGSTAHNLGNFKLFQNAGVNFGDPIDSKFDSNLNSMIAAAQQRVGQQKQENTSMSSRRLVKVIIVDPNENIPLDCCVLYSGDEKMTDATDQELFFEIDIKKILDEHNAKRIKLIDKKVKERTEYLEPAKIRDLKMVVVNIASF